MLIAGTLLVVLGLVAAAGALVYLQTSYTTVKAGGAMEPTFREGDRIPIEKVGGAAIRRGDVVLYEMSGRYRGLPVLQRVVGLGGDHLVFSGGSLTVNGRPVEEPYVKEDGGPSGTPAFDVTVPPGRMFLLGDNRGNSNESRYFLSEGSGTVPVSAVRGRPLASGTAPTLLGLAVVLGVVCTVVGGGLSVSADRRARMSRTSVGPTPFT
ncbi:signal peptidase I [Streptomyces sp. NPDC005752]|uniref:signal peptidase I n=1 Tax=Streptomyces sp. NPDC005752 TaxID=3157065 RepID=UPI00340F1E66